MPTAAPAKGDNKAAQAQQQVSRRPFIVGSRQVDKSIYDVTKTMSATSQQRYDTYELDTDGFTSWLYLYVEAITAGNSATVAFKEDAPTNALAMIQFSDTGNKAIIGPMTGHDLAMCVKYGGYSFSDDPRMSPIYSATTGAGATGGSFTYCLKLPLEIVHRDALGALLNKSASAVYKADLTLAATTDVYSTAPTNPPSVRVRIQQFGWMDSNGADLRGNPVSDAPPALNTVQFWDKQSYTVNAGNMNQKLNTFSGMVRNLIFELRDSSGTRTGADADFPDPFTFQYETSIPVQRIRGVWRHMLGELYGYNNPAESAGGRDYATYVLPYNQDFGLKPGAESRFGYLVVSSATSLVARGTIGGSGAHQLNVLVNYVNPAGGDPRALTGGR